MSYVTIEKSTWVTITEEDIKEINQQGEIEKLAWVDIDMDEFDDDDIISEYESRFNYQGPDAYAWRDLYEQRRSLPVEDFLKIIDNLIMNQTGRVL